MRKKIFSLLLLILSLPLRGMEIERPVRHPVMTEEARARAHEATDGNEEDGNEGNRADQAQGGSSFPRDEGSAEQTSGMVFSTSTTANLIEEEVVSIKAKVRTKMSQLRAEIEYRSEDIQYAQNIKKAIMVLQKIEGFLLSFEETSFSNEDEKILNHFEFLMKSDALFEMAAQIEEESEMVSHYKADILSYRKGRLRNLDVVNCSKAAMKCAQWIIDLTVSHSELFVTDIERAGYLTDAIDAFSLAEKHYDAVVEGTLGREKKREMLSSCFSTALLQAAHEYHVAALEAVKADEWVQKRIRCVESDNFILENVRQYNIHQNLAKRYLQNIDSLDKAATKDKTNPTPAKPQIQLTDSFNELAYLCQKSLFAEKNSRDSSAESNDVEVAFREEQKEMDPHKLKLLQRVKELQQQKLLQSETTTRSRACIIM